eukprot:CAMPEP_0119041712 /NCGR_PEP_ID=MMETSP1177-20130426/13145_1 /TAXON_ID=2985 /ORGANISM="Ochromonas sp, Strain CCMP1899" /LENGTH=350 /DNA_ID=CAMNT_0007007965 /DNA_START=88 /DNA_END=1140 /DNA_ORIENTATION=+
MQALRLVNSLSRQSKKTVKNFNKSCARGIRSVVIAEHAGGELLPGTYATVTAATKICKDVDILLTGYDIAETVALTAAGIPGVNKVVVLHNRNLQDSSTRTAEDMCKAILGSGSLNGYTHILHSSSNNGKSFIPRMAAMVDSSPLTDVIEVIDHETFKRPMYAGNAITTVKMTDEMKFLLIRSTTFEKAPVSGGSAEVKVIKLKDEDVRAEMSYFVSNKISQSERPDLNAAKVVVSGGRGMKSGDNFHMIETLADKLGGAVGASRAAVDAGYAPNDCQVGQTGKVVAPDLYIAVGISGAIQHLSGMKDSKVIVAINKDKEAPIFQVADYGLVGDLFKILPEINEKINQKA